MKKFLFPGFMLILSVSLFSLGSEEINIAGEREIIIALPYVDITFSYSFKQQGKTAAIFKGEINGDMITGECRLGGSKTYGWRAEKRK